MAAERLRARVQSTIAVQQAPNDVPIKTSAETE